VPRSKQTVYATFKGLKNFFKEKTHTAFSDTPLSNQSWLNSLQALLIAILASKLSTQLDIFLDIKGCLNDLKICKNFTSILNQHFHH